ncbi:MAG: hypothetical protein KF897_00960 [Opitutaceae bacterium]|nr:hypothetical protein [Opitutaceae bacterium]
MSSTAAISQMPALGTEQLLAYGLDKWNHQPGGLWGIRCAWDAAAWAELKAREAQIFDGRRCLAQPGPFKRLGAFAVLNQYGPCFRLFECASGRPLDAQALALWVPRVTLWLQSFYGSGLTMNQGQFRLPLGCPTLHFQVDLIGYLRSVYGSLADDPACKAEDDVLTERIITMGLIIEAAAYAVAGGLKNVQGFVTGSGNCFERCDARFLDEQLIDIYFNAPKFLTDAVDIGVN